MKNRIIILAAAISVLAVSCQKEEIPTPVVEMEPVVITAGVETKTSLAGDGTTINWTDGDQVAVFYEADGAYVKSGNHEFFATEISGNEASFVGSVAKGTEEFYAVYPYDKAIVATPASVVVNIPATQYGKNNTFDEDLNISVARVIKNPGVPEVSAEFKNVCALLKFSVPRGLGTITRVQITADKYIAGNLTVKESSSSISETATASVTPSTTIQMTPNSSDTFSAENTFWFVLAPVELKTLVIEVEAKNGYTYTMTKEWEEGYGLKAGTYSNLGTLEMKKASAVAAHKYSSSGVLEGTTLNITLPDDDSEIKEYHLIVKKDGTAVDGWNDISSLIWTKPTAYPYLPKGEYSLSGTYTLKNGTLVTLGESIFIVPAPFDDENPLAVDHRVYTSYTYYTEGNISEANDCLPLVIYNKSVPNISSRILDNAAYNSIKSIKINTTEGDMTVSAYGEHTVSSTFTFDDVTSTESGLKCYITGLPYILDPSSNDEWSLVTGKQEWNKTIDYDLNFSGGDIINTKKAVRLGYKTDEKSSTIKKSFYVPTGVSINTTMSSIGVIKSQVQVNIFGGTYKSPKNSISLFVGPEEKGEVVASETLEEKNMSISLNIRDVVYSSKGYSIVGDHSLSENNCEISFTNSYNGKKGTVLSYYSYTDITNFTIDYRAPESVSE
jgi:hypothetical protein